MFLQRLYFTKQLFILLFAPTTKVFYCCGKVGIHQSNISDWENNISRPDYEKLIELAKIYNVTLYQLLGINDPFL
ncbi:MAG: helix-turn-helix transcriptional regulator [Clostridia bacterium]|nr:helix-turn-helix transcriptional regulator [Clostridia bacterium]